MPPMPDHVQRQTWATATHYKPEDEVVVYDQRFRCCTEHESSVFGNDFFDRVYWVRCSETA